MPGSLVELSGRPGDEDSDYAGNEVWRASKYEGDGVTEAKRLDNCGEKVLEAVRGEMHMSHEGKDPSHRVAACLFKALERGRFAVRMSIKCCQIPLKSDVPFALDGVQLHTIVRKLLFIMSQPLGS